jgi:hypothetical protein
MQQTIQQNVQNQQFRTLMLQLVQEMQRSYNSNPPNLFKFDQANFDQA